MLLYLKVTSSTSRREGFLCRPGRLASASAAADVPALPGGGRGRWIRQRLSEGTTTLGAGFMAALRKALSDQSSSLPMAPFCIKVQNNPLKTKGDNGTRTRRNTYVSLT